MQHIRQVMSFVWPYLLRYRGRLALGLVLGLAYGVFNASFVWGTKTIFERLDPPAKVEVGAVDETPTGSLAEMNRQVMQRLDPWLPQAGRSLDWRQALGGMLLLPVLILIRGVISYSSVYCLGWVAEHAVRDIRQHAHEHLQALSIEYYHRTETGRLLTMLNKGANTLAGCMTWGFAYMLKEPFCILGILTALFVLDWQLAMFGVVFAPLCLIPILIIGRKVRKVAQKSYDANTEQDSLLVEVYGNMKTVKAFGMEQTQLGRFSGLNQRLMRAGIKRIQAQHLLNPVIELLGMLGLGLVLVFVFYTEKSVPELVGFLTGMMMLFQPFKRLGNVNSMYQDAAVGVKQLEVLIAEKPDVLERDGAGNLEPIANSIAFKGVDFAYEDQPVLQDLNLEMLRGTRLGVAGESGAGKSTLANLLLRFYDPQSGGITVDGTNIREVTLESLRGQMALVSQEVVIFDQSVAENIACGNLDASREEIETAAKAANAHEFIRDLPESYDTRLGEQGTRLSGGQRQRIAIARAFVRQAPILILDEATAALDSKAEAEVQSAIERLEEGRTVLCVAHRLSTLRNMDRIIVLEAGRIVESGSFDELLQRDGVFAQMARKQGLA
tara:strand:- start:161 stop:1990 length:1830 start_codon:yes stop_codon:yes gene_type:complete